MYKIYLKYILRYNSTVANGHRIKKNLQEFPNKVKLPQRSQNYLLQCWFNFLSNNIKSYCVKCKKNETSSLPLRNLVSHKG